jgi:2-iminobutanoate/2-iminopropanoate deaminase
VTPVSARLPVTAPDAPAAIGPYSHAVRHGDLLFCSGQIPLRPEDGTLVDDSLAAATRQCLKNLAAVCEAAGTDLGQALQLTVYSTELEGFAAINDAYAEFFGSKPPARAAVGVVALPKGARVEVAGIVAVP